MTQHDPWARVRHMRDHAEEAVRWLGEKTLQELKSDRVLQRSAACSSDSQIIGEAALRVDPTGCAAHGRSHLGTWRPACATG